MAMPTDTGQFEVRHCHQIEQFRQCVELQKTVWQFADRDLIPTRMFVVARKIEGQVIAAFAPDGRMAGFCLAIPALHGRRAYLHSHMLAVLPEFRRAQLGQRLKWEQRRDALARGIGLIEWTFDPLEWQNAALNLNRLGAIARRYVPNLYGVSSSPLHRGLPTDRLIAEWWLESPRVAAAAERSAIPPPAPVSKLSFSLNHQLVAAGKVPQTAQVQQHLRTHLQQAFSENLAAAGFFVESDGRGSYLLAPVNDLGCGEI